MLSSALTGCAKSVLVSEGSLRLVALNPLIISSVVCIVRLHCISLIGARAVTPESPGSIVARWGSIPGGRSLRHRFLDTFVGFSVP